MKIMLNQDVFRKAIIIYLLFLAGITGRPILAAVRLPAILSDNMVIQQGRPVTIWGWSDPGEHISIELNGQSASATGGTDMTWSVRLGPFNAGGPYVMKVSGNNSIVVNNILVGEVWLGSGQSNMEQPMAGWDFKGDGVRASPIINSALEIAAANYPLIRIFTVIKKEAGQPQDDCEGKWLVCTPENAPGFSATGYFFSRYLFSNLGVPVGFIHSSWGGSAIEPWIPAPAFDKDGALNQGYDYLLRTTDIEHWHKSQQPHGTFYNGMIAPILHYAIRGILWYQGEANTVAAHAYGHAFITLISEWRKAWQSELPFCFVQLAPYDYTRHVGHGWPIVDSPQLRQAQLSALALPGTGMVVTTDIGDSVDIHPGNKEEIGRRLGLLALGISYHKEIDFNGPVFRSFSIEDNHIRIKFDYAKSGLKSSNGKSLDWFTLAGEDRVFFKANAVIEGDCIVVSSPAVAKPVAVRFAWADVANHNLVNLAGLPASPFRTDAWPTPQEVLDRLTPKK